VVEAALALVDDREAALKVLDLGTGTGCLLVALLHELPNAWGLGVDRSEGAARTAASNAMRLGVGGRSAFVVGDWASPLATGFDLVVSNPPYIAEGELPLLEPEVRLYDPPSALAAGDDGLAAYRAIARDLDRLLAPDGRIVVEVGRGQAEDVAAILARAGVSDLGFRSDLAGIPRAVFGQKKIGNDLTGR
jgi:release factor glutamine methyltransferase